MNYTSFQIPHIANGMRRVKDAARQAKKVYQSGFPTRYGTWYSNEGILQIRPTILRQPA